MSYKLVLADDSVTIQKVVELTFSEEDATITAVADGSAAWERVRTEKPDIILSDVIMPGIDGYELCSRVKADPQLRSTPFLFLTGTFESFDEERAKECGADGHIVKPFDSQELIDRVHVLLEARPAQAEAPAPPAEAPAPAPAPTEAVAPAPTPPVPAGPVVADMPPPPPPVAAMEPPPAPAGEPAPADDFDFGGDITEDILSGGEPAEEPVPAPSTESPGEFFEQKMGAGDAAAAPDEEDLWSEVNLGEHPSPLSEEQGLDEESLWTGEAAASPPAPGEELGEELLMDEVITEAPVELETEVAPPPPAVEAPQPVEAPAPVEAPPPAAAPAPPSMPPEPVAAPVAAPPSPPAKVDAGKLQESISGAIEAAVRDALGPVISEAARAVVEEVAWEVVPELAEAMIGAEIRKITEEAGKESGPAS